MTGDPLLLDTLARMERNFHASNNVLFIWNIIAFCTQHDLPIPEFALAYVKQVAVDLASFTKQAMLRDEKDKENPEEISKRVLDALRITTGQGRPNAFEGMRRLFENENALLMEAVRQKVGRQQHYGSPEEKAAAIKARRRALAAARVQRGWTKPPPKPSA